jgi:hypothetical protein
LARVVAAARGTPPLQASSRVAAQDPGDAPEGLQPSRGPLGVPPGKIRPRQRMAPT